MTSCERPASSAESLSTQQVCSCKRSTCTMHWREHYSEEEHRIHVFFKRSSHHCMAFFTSAKRETPFQKEMKSRNLEPMRWWWYLFHMLVGSWRRSIMMVVCMETQLLLFFFFCCFFAGRWRKESVHDCYKKRHNFQLSETHPDNVAFPSFRLMLSVFRFFQDCWTRVYVSKRGFSVEEFSNFCRKQKENGNYSCVPIVSPLSLSTVVNSHIRFPPVPSQRISSEGRKEGRKEVV